jgi:hypothetical protein
MTVLGVDIGSTGAVALIDEDGELLEVHDMPSLNDGIAPGKAGAKDAARSEAIRRWPVKAALFARQKDDGRAEAALIAVAGLKRGGERDYGHLSAGQAAPRAIGAS